MKFEELQLDPLLLKQISRMGYTETTPIQSRSIPMIMEGKDLLGQAQTGSGKTAAFALPIIQKLLGLPQGSTRVLVVAPTRELAEQIHTSFEDLGRASGIRSATVYGGVGMGPQIRKLSCNRTIGVILSPMLAFQFGLDKCQSETVKAQRAVVR